MKSSKNPERPKSTVIILNWNNALDTIACLDSVQKLDYPNYEVLIVDNGSKDDSVAQIRTAYPSIPLIQNPTNLGFAGGNNMGIEYALARGSAYVLLLNNDTVIAPDALTHAIEAAKKHPHLGAIGLKIYYFDEPATIWYAGGGIDPQSGRCYHVGCGSADPDPKYAVECETDYACGCAMLVPKETIEKVGPLDPKYFLIWEEIDWCYRMRERGLTCQLAPKARVWHKVSASFIGGNRGPQWSYYYHRNQVLFHKRHTKKKIPPPWSALRACLSKDLQSRRVARASLRGYCGGLLQSS